MRRKNTTSEQMKAYIIESLLLLMKKQAFSEITISKISEKAGVNRSTYYRNFRSKEEILEAFFRGILEQAVAGLPKNQNLTLLEYLTHIFKAFYEHKKDILCIHRNRLTHLLLHALNFHFSASRDIAIESFQDRLPLYYHTGGIFNNFILWFDCRMEPAPEVFAEEAVKICLPDAKPILLQHRESIANPVRPQ